VRHTILKVSTSSGAHQPSAGGNAPVVTAKALMASKLTTNANPATPNTSRTVKARSSRSATSQAHQTSPLDHQAMGLVEPDRASLLQSSTLDWRCAAAGGMGASWVEKGPVT
jgi:hypothetical protein